MNVSLKKSVSSQAMPRPPLNKQKAGTSGYWRNRRYGSVSLRRRNKLRRSASVSDKNFWSISMEEADSDPNIRNSEIMERDMFLDLISKVQDNRYENQRYVLKAGTTKNPDETDEGAVTPVNGAIPNGDICSNTSTPDIPAIEVSPSDSPPISFQDDDSSTAREDSLTPPAIYAGSAVTPGRRAMMALQKVIAEEGPFPMVIEPPDKGWVIQVDEDIDSACGEDGLWAAPEISTDHYSLDSDTAAFAYGRHFVAKAHKNYMGRDPKVGPVLFSMVKDEDYRGSNLRLILRTQNDVVYRVVPESQLYHMKEIEDVIKFVSKLGGIEEIKVERAIRILYPKVHVLIQKFDEHKVVNTHKFGVIYQKFNQTSEEELFRNQHSSPALHEFLEILGDTVQLKGFNGYRGGLDILSDQTGEHSVYTEYKGREVMFHVSTLLPYDESDLQQVQKKRHIGNDIVVVVFQEENTPFCPNMVRSHFVHCYIVVQVEHPNTDHTVYKVSIACKDRVPEFGPPLNFPAVFKKGPDFRDWLLTKLLNAEFNCHKAPDFLKLANRTHSQLFLHLIEDIANTMDDVDYPGFGKGFAQSFEANSYTKSPRRQRRKTFSTIFNRRDNLPIAFSFPKRKSSETTTTKSPSYQKLRMRSSSGMNMPPIMVGSTPDLSIIAEDRQSSRSYTGSPDEAKSAENTLTKRKLKRRFTFTRGKSPSKSAMRPSSEAVTPGADFSSMMFRRRKKSTQTPKAVILLSKRDSSDDSSINSGLNWSIPSDLPGVVENRMDRGSMENIMFMDPEEIRARCRSTPTIAERRESESSIAVSEMRISQNGPLTADVAVQVDAGEPIFQFPDILPGNSVSHYDLLQTARRSPPQSRSMPHSPYANTVRGTRPPLGSVHRIVSYSREARENREITGHHEGRVMVSTRGQKSAVQVGSSPQLHAAYSRGQQYSPRERLRNGNGGSIMKAGSVDNISTDIDDVYDSLLSSVQSLTLESNKLREENMTLHRENARLASQNQKAVSMYKAMKQELADAQRQVETLQLKLKLFNPDFQSEDD